MEQQHKNLPAVSSSSASSSSGSSSSSSSSRSIHGSMSSAFLGVSSSSSTHSQSSQRRSSSPSLYPPPLPPAPLSSSGHHASAASAGGSALSSGSSPSSQFLHQISHSPGAVAKRRSRPNLNTRITHSLPPPFLSELSAIRRMGNNVSGDLNAQAQEIMAQRRPLLHQQQQQQEMTLSSSSSLFTMPHHHTTTPMPSGEFSGFPGFAPPPLQQPSFSTLQPLPGAGNFSGFSLPASQHFSSTTYVSPLPSWSTIYQSSSSCSAHHHGQPSSDDSSELTPLPPSLEIPPQCDLPPLGQLSWNNGPSIIVDQSRSAGFVQPSSNSEAYELAPLPESVQIPAQLLQQVKQEPVSSVVAPSLDPEIVLLDDDGDVDELSALVHSSFASSHSHGGSAMASLPNPMQEHPTNFELEGMHGQGLHQLGGSGSGLNMRGVGVGQTWHQAVPTPATVHDMVNNGGGGSSGSVPWKDRYSFMAKYSLAEEEAMQKLSHLLSLWSSTASSSCDQSMGSSVTGSSQGMQALANKFDMMSIGATSSSSSSAGTKLPWNYSSLSVENYSNTVPAVPKLMLGGMERRPGLPPRPAPPAHGAGDSSSMSRRGGTKEHYFSEAEMEKINKDKRLKELAEADSRRVKRILRNWEYAETIANLKTENRHMEIKLQGLQEQVKLSQDLNNQLQSEIERRKYQS